MLVPVLLNGFPFIFPDSGDYLVLKPLIHRSPYYGLFIFIFHMNRWIWLPVLAQAVIVSHLLWLMLTITGARNISRNTVTLALLLTVFSSLPFFVGYIMADFFTPIMFILMYIIGLHFTELPRLLRLYLMLLACVATAAHVSNLTMAIVILCLFSILLPWCGRSWADTLKHLGFLSIPIGLTAAAVLLFNTVVFGTFSLVPAGSSFLLANLIQYGPARAYLKEACPDAGYKICAYVNRLPETADDLLWMTGIFKELGSFTGMKSESRAIVVATIEQYPSEVAGMVANNFIAGLFRHEPGAEFRPEPQDPSMIDLFATKFGHGAVSAYLGSAEMRRAIPHGWIRRVDSVVVPVAFLALTGLGLFAARRGFRQNAALAAVMIFAVLENTLLCTAVSGVYDRYQARATWLLPMAVFVVASSLAARSRQLGGARGSTGPVFSTEPGDDADL